MLHHKIADESNRDDPVANFMKDVMEQTKLQKTVYSKYDEKGKNGGCLLEKTPGKLKEDSNGTGVTAVNKTQKEVS